MRDHSDDEMFAKRNMAVFVVPRGAERDLNIDSEEAQAQVHDSAGHTRLVIVTLGKGQSFESLDQIKDELNPKIVDIIPSDCTNRNQVPYFSTSTTLHQKETVHENKTLRVEDCVVEGETPKIVR